MRKQTNKQTKKRGMIRRRTLLLLESVERYKTLHLIFKIINLENTFSTCETMIISTIFFFLAETSVSSKESALAFYRVRK